MLLVGESVAPIQSIVGDQPLPTHISKQSLTNFTMTTTNFNMSAWMRPDAMETDTDSLSVTFHQHQHQPNLYAGSLQHHQIPPHSQYHHFQHQPTYQQPQPQYTAQPQLTMPIPASSQPMMYPQQHQIQPQQAPTFSMQPCVMTHLLNDSEHEDTGTQDLDTSLTDMQWVCDFTPSATSTLITPIKKAKHEVSKHDVVEDFEDIQYMLSIPPEKQDPTRKPDFAYAALIMAAIVTSKSGKMPLCDIYTWIQDHFPYYKHAEPGWKNSIRHNLSLNKHFIKVPRSKTEKGKGAYWTLARDEKGDCLKVRLASGRQLQRENSTERPPEMASEQQPQPSQHPVPVRSTILANHARDLQTPQHTQPLSRRANLPATATPVSAAIHHSVGPMTSIDQSLFSSDFDSPSGIWCSPTRRFDAMLHLAASEDADAHFTASLAGLPGAQQQRAPHTLCTSTSAHVPATSGSMDPMAATGAAHDELFSQAQRDMVAQHRGMTTSQASVLPSPAAMHPHRHLNQHASTPKWVTTSSPNKLHDSGLAMSPSALETPGRLFGVHGVPDFDPQDLTRSPGFFSPFKSAQSPFWQGLGTTNCPTPSPFKRELLRTEALANSPLRTAIQF
ncbi:uncharacterized protein MONBRDRAFT_26588 [Monosiga brevicollis MX1]|uniref:Fork-head domain-containing protein n=1 Tax=Monosiga brevicollis TaxID=81824 RepID=A9V2T2_MONBE|nr:uncharacterized protein MONBRDRAFT_26588 [Monosiga brevicollis MX1]EDQ87940.1 predicted protein [Monosiga brevicollis MX1]|eukprot:XP_001747016.1 hypothetical protein [Monosiga brevicollis MX1]